MTRKLTKSKESATRKKIDNALSNLRWCIDEYSPKCNVFTERAKTVEQQKKLNGKEPDYVLYKSGTDEPIGIIEAKKPNQNLYDALTQGIELYAKPLGIHIVFSTDGSIVQTHDIRSNAPLRIDGEIITDFLSEKELFKFIEEGAERFTEQKVSHTKRELITIFSEANDLLRKEGIREGMERFTEFSNLLFLKLISELEKDREENGEARTLEERYCWDSFSKRDPQDMMDYINDTIFPKLRTDYNHSGDVFQEHLLIQKPDTLKRIVDKLSPLQLMNTDSDIKGDAFEYFLKNSVTVGNDLGEYYTPRHIVRLVVDLVDPLFEDTVYDPCCGTGGFLIQAFRHIRRKIKPTKKNIAFLKEKTIFGNELTGTAKIAKLNMILIGDGHNNIKQQDSLGNPASGDFDVVLTNFPFSQKTDYSQLYGFESESANPIFLKHVIDALKKGGKAGIVVPEGLLFDERSECVKIRQILMQTCNLTAIIKLHGFVFKPYTGQPTSILLFEKGTPTKKTWFFDVQQDGFKQSSSKNGRDPIKEDDLVLLRQIWSTKEDSDRSLTVDANAIASNKFKLSMDNYAKTAWKKDGGKMEREKLGSVCDIRIGGTPSRKNMRYWGGENCWVKISDMDGGTIMDTPEKITDDGVENSNVKLLPKGTVLFSFKLTVGKMAIAGRDLYTNEAIAGLVPKDGRVLPKFIYYVMPRLDYKPYMQRATKGNTLNKDIMQEVLIPLPSIKEQEKFIRLMDDKEVERKKLHSSIDKVSSQEDSLVSNLLS